MGFESFKKYKSSVFDKQISDYVDLNAFEIKKLKKNQYLIYLPDSKESYIVDHNLYAAIIFLVFKRSRKELLKYLKQKELLDYYDFLEENLMKKQNQENYVKFEFIKKINKHVLLFFFLAALIIMFYGSSILLKNPFKADDLYYFKGLSFVLLSYLVWFSTAIIHEFMHLLMGNYFDVDGKIYFKFYFIFPALVTELPRTVMLKKYQRLLIHTIGIITDLFFMSLFLIGSLYVHKEFFRFAAILKFLSIVSQFKIYYKTDLYFIIEDLCDAFNVKEESKILMKKIIKNERIRKYEFYNPLSAIFVYLLILVLGWIFQIYVLLTYFIPFLIVMHKHNLESRLIVYSFLILWLFFNFKKIVKLFYLRQAIAKNQDAKEQY